MNTTDQNLGSVSVEATRAVTRGDRREILWPSMVDRAALRAKQDRIIEIAEQRGMPFDIPISEAQAGSPTVLQLHSQIWPDYLPSINSFLNTFDKR